MSGIDVMWRAADGALLRCDGATVSQGRNRAYDPPGGPDRLQRTPVAHAEMNALAAVETAAELNGMTRSAPPVRGGRM